MKDGNIHSGHRERVKKSFLESGFDGFSDINKLEMLLFYSIPRIDTNVIAHNLINEFGSLSAVFDAPKDMLLKVKGVTPNTAILISMIRELFNSYECNKIENSKIVFDSAETTIQYCISKLIGKTDEHLYALMLDNNHSLINAALISKGTPNTSSVHIRKIIEHVVATNATSVILCHNHPNGVAAPSSEDLYTTKEIVDALKYLNVRLLDHVIVAERDAVSLAKNKKFSYLFR